jgi:retinol dehydrogenase 12
LNPFLKLFFSKTIPAGAQTTIHVAVEPKLRNVTGKYFRECKVAETSAEAKDFKTSAWLWRKSEQLTGVKFS